MIDGSTCGIIWKKSCPYHQLARPRDAFPDDCVHPTDAMYPVALLCDLNRRKSATLTTIYGCTSAALSTTRSATNRETSRRLLYPRARQRCLRGLRLPGDQGSLPVGIEGECGVTKLVILEFSAVSTRRSHVFFGVHSRQKLPLVRHTPGAHQNVCNFHELARQGRMCRTQLSARTSSFFVCIEGNVRTHAKQKKLHAASAISEAAH